ncbi:protein-disulfide reductase DsbD N-terminal domain-containing protein [Herbaspirillum sp. ST 5-3]|uniref:protein-disulfide reductase DsbD N-terminal domain-containing protein n=1 Tax=Oxalobacteraceae TaxID=75682 RepID=UPI001FFFB20B|nr:protein-disulfide reductase DsbD N-terminal domain-containing protein [Herbaspirillum sp. ST 5-3]
MRSKKALAGWLLAALSLSLTCPVMAQQSSPSGLSDKVKGLFSNTKEDELVEPDVAFKMKAVAKTTNLLAVDLTPANGYYVYKERIKFSVKDTAGIRINNVKLPVGEMKTDQIFGRTEVFKKNVPITITLDNAAKGKNITLFASYQGCHEKLGVCYPPIEKSVTLVLP